MARDRLSNTLAATGQAGCYDTEGQVIPCDGTGQDAAYRRGAGWDDEQRLQIQNHQVTDTLTGLIWPRDANIAEFPVNWQEALDLAQQLNRQVYLGATDWRLPNRRELRSLISHQTGKPALPQPHPFKNLFQHWYWSSTSFAGSPRHAWYVSLHGGRMFYGGKDQSFMFLPVRGRGNELILASGQRDCFDVNGDSLTDCAGSGQDGEYQFGRSWPVPRFEPNETGIKDHLTGLVWHRNTDLADGVVTWDAALRCVQQLNGLQQANAWRLPNINELESLCDSGRAFPAIDEQELGASVKDVYWSSTTSCFEPDWAWALYLDKGAVGVGQKKGESFHVWPVRDNI